MNEDNLHPELADRLASHGVESSDERLGEHWRDIEVRVQAMTRRDRRARLILLILGGLTLAGLFALLSVPVISPGTYPLRPIFDHVSESIAAVVISLLLAIPVSFFFLLVTYFLNHRPRLQQAEYDQIVVMLIDLERQVRELQRRVDGDSSKSSESPTRN